MLLEKIKEGKIYHHIYTKYKIEKGSLWIFKEKKWIKINEDARECYDIIKHDINSIYDDAGFGFDSEDNEELQILKLLEFGPPVLNWQIYLGRQGLN